MITNPDPEQQQALDELVSEYNLATGSSLTAEQWQSQVVLNLINERKWRNVDEEGARLVAGSKAAPDAKRLEFLAEVKKLYAQIIES